MFQSRGPKDDPWGHPRFIFIQSLVISPSFTLFCLFSKNDRINPREVFQSHKPPASFIDRLPCIGFAQWRGCGRGKLFRTQFNLRRVVPVPMQSLDTTNFFSSRLLEVTRDFIAKRLGALFASAHIRAEKMLTFGVSFNNNTSLKTCISNLTTLVERSKNAPIPLFLATDFGDYGSLSKRAIIARENANSLMKVLEPLKPIIFSAFNLQSH